jgi:SAM-dependent methyltransferase
VRTDGEDFRSRRLAAFYEFVLSEMPSPPARVLEVGCGDGELSRGLTRAGYSMVGIDPEAPEGAIFRRIRLEDFHDEGEFDAVVASVSLHHVDDPGSAVERVEQLLRDGGLLVLEEFAKERFTGATAEWYYHQRRALAAVGGDATPITEEFEVWLHRWHEEHADIHPLAELRRELEARFTQRYGGWVPYLFDYALKDSLEPLERELIESGAIEATGFRYIGERSRRPGAKGAATLGNG